MPRGIVSADSAALRAVRTGSRMRSEAARTNSISGLGWSGSQGFAGNSISVPSGLGSTRRVPTSSAETPSTSAWCVLERIAWRPPSRPSIR